MRVLTVVGNRPQFVKAAAVSRRLREAHEEILVHTGQHYDDELSASFFRDLELPQPDCELGVGSDSHAQQTAAILTRLEPVVAKAGPDLVMVYGDTNSTLGGALVAAKLQVPVAHLEAGMRSFDRSMPEEINRVLTDHCADVLLCSSETAVANLRAEGIVGGVYLVGDVMLDAALMFAAAAAQHADVLQRLELREGDYVVVTAHRQGNVDDRERLERLVELLAALTTRFVFPVHPRTRKCLGDAGIWDRLTALPNAVVLPPVGYLDFTELLRHATAVLTDSGGIQKEAYLFGVPCVTLRDRTEWVETVELGWNQLVDLDADAALRALATRRPQAHPDLYGGGSAAGELVSALDDWGLKQSDAARESGVEPLHSEG